MTLPPNLPKAIIEKAELFYVDPTTIAVDRGKRQRSAIDTEDLIDSIRTVGIINPIVVLAAAGASGSKWQLITGERRLAAALQLHLPTIPAISLNSLPLIEQQIIELEENLKRKELNWRDEVKAICKLHQSYQQRQGADWSESATAAALSISVGRLAQILVVGKEIDTPRLELSTGINHAYSILARAAERKTAEIVGNIVEKGANLFNLAAPAPASATAPVPAAAAAPVPAAAAALPVLCADFISWSQSYSGPKFNLIHCDFPYGVPFKNYGNSQPLGKTDYASDSATAEALLAAFTANLDRFASYSAHFVFWFNMHFFSSTKATLEKAGLEVFSHFLIWHKSDNVGIIPGNTGDPMPRNTYETAFLARRGGRRLIASRANSFAAPSPTGSIHPSQKSEPMLRHFFEMLVDETTLLLDPTAGSGAALRAAESLGAAAVFGIEISEVHADSANKLTLAARRLRKASKIDASAIAASSFIP